MTLEEALEKVLKKKGCYFEACLNKIVAKRVVAKEECFQHLPPEIA